MSSAKNTVVAILLLGVSYGVYQVINAPDAADPLAGLIQIGMPGPEAGNEETPQTDDWTRDRNPVPRPEVREFAPISGGRDEVPAIPPLAKSPAQPPALPASAASAASAASVFSTISPPSSGASFSSQSAASSPGESNSLNSSSQGGIVSVNPPASGSGLQPVNLAGNPGAGSVSSGAATSGSRFGSPKSDVVPQISPPNPIAQVSPSIGGSYASAPSAPAAPLSTIWVSIDEQINSGDFRGALERLTPYHESTKADDPERERLSQYLDALAAKVIFSTEHHLAPQAHLVQEGETLESIANRWNIPPQLLYNVNRELIPNPQQLQAGTQLKQIPGPFRVIVRPDQNEMILQVGGLYAWRFVTASIASSLPRGTWRVIGKQDRGHTCGDYCIQLDAPGTAIHAISSDTSGIAMQVADAEELFGILSNGSEVIVR